MTCFSEIYERLCTNQKTPIDAKIYKAFSEAEKTGELNISGMSVTSQTCEVLSRMVSDCRDITKLNASDCLLPPQGLAALLSAMHLTQVHTVQLRGNNIAGPSVYKLAKMLCRSRNIRYLGLEWNSLGLCSEGLLQFCDALSSNNSLEVLDLRNNQLDEQCAAMLASALRRNTGLRVLDVRWNALEQAGGQNFLAALQTNKTLTALKLQGNSISNDLLTAIEQCIKHNVSLRQLQCGYEARKEVLAEHLRAVTSQRAEDLRHWAEKSQRQVTEMDTKVKEAQALLADKQREVDDLARQVKDGFREMEALREEVKRLQQEFRTKEESYTAVIRDYQLQLETLNKALAANKNCLSDLERKLEEEILQRESMERERTKDKERMKEMEEEISRRKEELQKTITEHIGAIEDERRQAQQRLTLAAEEWSSRLEQSAAEHNRTEQVCRERLRAAQSALTDAEARQAEWVTERANIWVEAREKESCKVMVLTEKVEYMKEEKNSLESQLSVANTTAQQLQRDNSNMVADLADLRRKLSAVQEELSAERLLSQRLRSEKTEESRLVEATRADVVTAQKALAEAAEREEGLRREMRRLNEQLADRDRYVANIRKEEKDRAGFLFAAIKNYVDQINSTN